MEMYAETGFSYAPRQWPHCSDNRSPLPRLCGHGGLVGDTPHRRCVHLQSGHPPRPGRSGPTNRLLSRCSRQSGNCHPPDNMPPQPVCRAWHWASARRYWTLPHRPSPRFPSIDDGQTPGNEGSPGRAPLISAPRPDRPAEEPESPSPSSLPASGWCGREPPEADASGHG